MTGHYSQRVELPYYKLVREFLDSLGHMGSILDIGCLDTPVALWGDFDQRYTIDLRKRPALPGVTAIVGSWPDDYHGGSVDVVTCLQTLEHVTDPAGLVAPMFATASEAVVISVPYKWPAGSCKSHLQDPIDEAKLDRMVGRKADEVTVTNSANQRLVAVYLLGKQTTTSGLESR